MAATVILPGVLSVRCPVCGSAPGRPCSNRRGYLVRLGSHPERETSWLDEEAQG